jgi:hypothetical protein
MTSVAGPVLPLLELLDDMRSMIERIDNEGYAAPAPGRSSGGVGGHVRHCLDHIRAFVSGTRTGLCAYDRRVRGTDVETCRMAALHVIGDLERQLTNLSAFCLAAPLHVETQIDTTGSTLTTTSSIGRELVFVTSHTIHHNALVAHLLESQGVDMGDRFGLAPSTPSQGALAACAR